MIINDIPNDQKLDLIEYLSQFVSENKLQLFDKVLAQRTRFVTVALEDIYQSHNASACLRTCDCFGVQDIHVIENRNHYTINPDIALGSSKWINLLRYNKQDDNNTAGCIESLKSRGYKLVATTPHREDFTPFNLPLDDPVALLFGTEETGLSEEAMDCADYFLRVPIYGFTESFNISVSVALVLYNIMERLRETDIDWQLEKEEKLDIKLHWVRKVVKKHKLLEKKFFEIT
ncbi:MAG: RNA methyltransferase [Candidatus Electryonea clarkiae]|nr:RNA methyltransferase [Candidatus Electryonea clarkiae]MDP8288117.1 RNA methyltransferase [Candidatus Electryonea clarkiae]